MQSVLAVLRYAPAIAAAGILFQSPDVRWAVAFDFAERFSEGKATRSPSTEVRTDRAGGVSRTSIFQHPPLNADLSPASLIFEAVPLPEVTAGERLRLRVFIGMSDRIDRAGAPGADGCEFAIRVAEREVLSKAWDRQEWFELTYDLTEHAGKTIPIEFRVGARANSNSDWALWGDPRVEIVGRPWKPRQGPTSPALRLETLSRSAPEPDSDRTALVRKKAHGSVVVAAMDPFLDLPIQLERWSSRAGAPLVPPAPIIVAGEGPDPQNHTLVRVLGRHGIAVAQFLAFGHSVRGGVGVSVGRTANGDPRIVAAPLAADGPREVRVFDLDGLQTASFTPDQAVSGPISIAAGDFLTGRAGDEVAVFGGGEGRLFSLSGTRLGNFKLPSRQADRNQSGTRITTLARVHGSPSDLLLIHAAGSRIAYSVSFGPLRTSPIGVPVEADGIYPSAFGNRRLAPLPDETASRVAVIEDGRDTRVVDVGAYENLFWFQWYRPIKEGRHVRASDFAHLRTDHATDAGRDPERAANPASWTAEAIVGRYGSKGGFAGYLTDRPKLWEPCFTHRQPKGVFEGWLKAKESGTGLHVYPMLTRNGRPVEYGEFGNIGFYASTYAFGLPAIDNLYILPLRRFLRQLARPFRERPEHCAGLEPNHEHEIAVEADGSMGDYNPKMIEGFHSYLRRMYGGDDDRRHASLGARFDGYFDAPRNWERGPWDAYDPANPFHKAWTDYNRYVVVRRVAETFREALLAGFPPEIIKCHQIPDTYAVGNLQAFSDVTARFTPIDWMLNAGTGYGFTRYGVWYNRPHDALQDAHSSGFDAISIGEYQALTPDPKAAYEQLRFMFDHGVVSAHCMLWPAGHDRGYNDTMHQALERLVSEDPPRPGITGGVGQIRPFDDGRRRFDIACIGTGPNRTGLLKSLKADGSWEGTVYVVPFHAHVDVEPLNVPSAANVESNRPIRIGPLNTLDSGEQIEIVGRIRSRGTVGGRLEVTVSRAGLNLPGLNHSNPASPEWKFFRYVLRNQLPTDNVQITLSSDRGRVELRELRATRQTERTSKLTQGKFGGVRHRGAVTFDVVRPVRPVRQGRQVE